MINPVKDCLRDILSRRDKRRLTDDKRKRSAVLVPMYLRDGEWHIVFTKRTERMRDHKGQMSFPGGVCEKRDASLVSTALREAEEEIGIRAGDVEILGELDDEIPRTTNYVISPFVGVIPWPYRFAVDAEEVEEIIEVPVSTLLDESCLRRDTEIVDGTVSQAYFYHCKGVVVWGATARILNQLLGMVVRARESAATGGKSPDVPAPGQRGDSPVSSLRKA